MCENYLVSVHEGDILRILADSDQNKYFSVNINFLELFESDTNLGNALLMDPENSFKNWNEAVFNVQNNLIKEVDKKCTIKNNVNCRIYSLPPWPHVCRTTFPGNDDVNNFLQVTGTVVRMSARKLLEYQRQYVCTKCKFPITVEAKYDRRNITEQPKKCSNPEGCTGKNIITFGELDSYNCKDYQEIKIHEDLSKVGTGTVPGHMVVTLEDDLVNACKPGENVTITGIVKRRWSEFVKGVKITIDIVLKANHIQVNNSSGLSIAVSDDMRQFFDNFWKKYRHNPLVGRNIILKSISPEIYGRQLVKLAIAVVLAGGSANEENQISTGIDTRSESHLLLVGDPGTGKSQMLRFASRIVPRSVLTTGVGSTAAGLTVTAIMENGEWQLEAGALVMADGGICCIDEFNSMREHDRTSIHEAMEQQTISVAKAGMVCKLKTRCSVLAACNPKGNIDPSQPLCVNVAMSSPLLSRFDLILLLRDIVNEENDRKLADYLLNKSNELSGDGVFWSLEKLQAYYAFIKKESPKLTAESETILSTYYQLQRKFGSRNKSRTTVRLLESLIRLSQGHAKLIFHSEVEVIDTIFAIILIDSALDYESSLLNLNMDYESFLDNPEQIYWDLLENILGKLNLDYIYQREVEKIGINIKKSSQNTDISLTEGGTSPNSGDHRIITEDLVTSTPKRTTLLFSQRTQSQKELEQNYVNNSQRANQSLNAVQKTSVNKSQFLFSQRGQKVRQNMSENELNHNSISASKINSDIISTQNKPKLLFSQKRWTQKVPETSTSTEENRECLSNLFNDKNNKGNTVSHKISTDSGNISHFSQDLTNIYSQNPFNLRQDRTSDQKFSIFQKNNDLFTRDKVVYNFDKESTSKPTKCYEKEDPLKNSKNILDTPGFRKRNIDELKVGGVDKKNIKLSDIVKSNVPMDFDLDFSFTNIKMTHNKDDNRIVKNNVEHSKRGLSLNGTDQESGLGSQIKSNENYNLAESILEQPNIILNKDSSKNNSEVKENKPKSDNTLKIENKSDLTSPIKSRKKLKKHKNKTTNDMDLLNCMPSVNDDFKQYDLNIDWDLQENNEPSFSEQESERERDNLDHFGKKKTDILKGDNELYVSDHRIEKQMSRYTVAGKIDENYDDNTLIRNKSVGKSSELFENKKEKRRAPAPLVKKSFVDYLAKFEFISRGQREDNKAGKTGIGNINNIEYNVENKKKEIETNEADIIDSSQIAPKPSKKYKFVETTIVNKIPSFLTNTRSDNKISSDNEKKGNSNDLLIRDGNKLDTKKDAELSFKRLVSNVDLDEEFRNFEFGSSIHNPFGKSSSSNSNNNITLEHKKDSVTNRQAKEVKRIADKEPINATKSNFGNLDMNIKDFDLVRPIHIKTGNVKDTVEGKHELFDMTQNSRNQFIRNQFSFKKLDIKKMTSFSRSDSGDL